MSDVARMKCKIRNILLMVISLFAINANGAPVAYSINSDSGDLAHMDSLYSIDLATGADEKIGKLFDGIKDFIDTEGLAFAPDGTLWGIDDDSRILFPIDIDTGIVSFSKQVRVHGFPTLGGNDFGMTFGCDNILYVTSGRTGELHRVDLEGNIESVGALGANISAIAAYGKPTQLYGLGNGQFQDGGTDAPNLYSIDLTTGAADLVGALGSQAGGYTQGGLAFDEDGGLWAITDRSIVNGSLVYEPSQILKLDTNTGQATLAGTTGAVGFESLAISPPSGCEEKVPPPPPPPPFDLEEGPQAIPSLGLIGQLLTILFLLLVGLPVLRSRLS